MIWRVVLVALCTEGLQVLATLIAALRHAIVEGGLAGITVFVGLEHLDRAIGLAQLAPQVLGGLDLGQILLQYRGLVAILRADTSIETVVGIVELAFSGFAVVHRAVQALLAGFHVVARGGAVVIGLRAHCDQCQYP